VHDLKKLSVLLTLPIIIFAALFVVPNVSPVHALTGKVCLSSSTTCPAPGALLSVVDVNGTLNVSVLIAASDPLNGFDIQILTDNTVLNPVGVDASGTILPGGASTVLKCLNGVLVTGNACTTQDAIGVLHYAAISQTGGTTSGTTSGLLFKAQYTVVKATPGTSLNFNTGCTGTSQTNVCVTISNGNPASPLDFETTQGASFQNTQDFTLATSTSSIETPPSVAASFTATVTRLGGLTGTISLFTSAPGLTISPSTVQTTSPVTYTVSSATSALYNVHVTATFTGTVLGKATTITHSQDVSVLVAPTGFSVSVDPSSLTIPIGGSGTATVSVTSISGFNHGVALSTSAATPGVTASYSPSSVTAPVDGTATSTATISVATSVVVGTAFLNVTGSDGTTTHTFTVSLTISSEDFTITVVPGALSISKGLLGNALVILQSIGAFSGTVNLSATPTQPDNSTDFTLPCWTGDVTTSFCISPSGLPFRGGLDSPGISQIPFVFTPASVFLPAGGSVNATFTLTTSAPDATGVLNTTITASSGSISHPSTLVFSIQDYQLTLLSPSTVTIAQGGPSFISTTEADSLGGPGGFGFFNFVGVNYPADVPTKGVFVPQLASNTTAPFGFYCFVHIYDSNGNLIPAATIAQQGPVVFPGRFSRHQSGCGSSGARLLPGPNDVQGPGFFRTTAIAFPNTPPGVYTVVLNSGAGNLAHSISYKLVVVQPLVMTDFHWFRNIHLFGNIKPQSFSVNVTNPVGNPTLNLVVIITGTDPTGTITFTVASVKMQIAGGQTVTITLDQSMQSLVSGSANVIFTFSTTMKYGVTSLTVKSSLAAPAIPTSGSFTVRP
jgi:hypothetical protein